MQPVEASRPSMATKGIPSSAVLVQSSPGIVRLCFGATPHTPATGLITGIFQTPNSARIVLFETQMAYPGEKPSSSKPNAPTPPGGTRPQINGLLQLLYLCSGPSHQLRFSISVLACSRFHYFSYCIYALLDLSPPSYLLPQRHIKSILRLLP